MKSLGLRGEERLFPCESFTPQDYAAKKEFDKFLEGGAKPATGNVCLNADVAVGVMRSFYEHGFRVPQDLSLCCFGDALKASLSIPSITSYSGEDYSPEVNAIFDFYLGSGGDPSRLMYRSSSARLIVGESTAPRKKEAG
jgi:hypothetical protein